MKKTRYIKPQVLVIENGLNPMLFNASQEVQDGTVNFAPEEDLEIENEEDFI
jgi:hypothetical protein